MTHYSKSFHGRRQGQRRRPRADHRDTPKETSQGPPKPLDASADPALKEVFACIGKPAVRPITPDPFQLQALEAVMKTDCLVTAPTGAGKTWIAEHAIAATFRRGGRAWYASPLKALTNSKWVEFGDIFGQDNVGILTGDTKENSDAPIVVGTTEILRNQLYDVMHHFENLPCDLVILDEAHYLGDSDRGVVWEEIIMYLPQRINLLLLSATIGNGREIAHWLSTLRNKECVVIEEHTRPVPLHPLLLHPRRRLMPLLQDGRLSAPVAAYLEKTSPSAGKRRYLPPYEEILGVLRQYDLLPALVFLKSREECNVAVRRCSTASHPANDDSFDNDLETLLARFPFLRNHDQLQGLIRHRVGAHHGGQLPAWKFVVESMMKKGHLDAVFATSTVAAGVNFPARTVLLFNSDQFNGHEFSPLSATAFHQMTGRAGRRGQDNIGFMVVYPGTFMDIEHIKNMFFMKPDKIKSQLRSDFSMILNLLLSHTPDEIRNMFERSFADFQNRGKRKGKRQDLRKQFDRHLSFLQQEGFVDGGGRLTGDGMWASQLRLDQPLLIAECLKRDAFPGGDASLLAAVIAAFVYDRNQDVPIDKKRIPGALRRALNRVIDTTVPLARRMKQAGFSVEPLPLWPSLAIYDWARGAQWEWIIKNLHIAEGDFAMLISRTADNLNQLASLKDTHSTIALRALDAKQIILREPVVFDTW